MRKTAILIKLAIILVVASLVSTASRGQNGGPALNSQPRHLILAHYMPWYSADPASGQWGWHWSMNHFNPNHNVGGRRDIASHYYPLIGPYDSSDPYVLECQVLLMKFAGIDGCVIDWRGTDDYYDYATNNRNAELMAQALRNAGLRYAILYEDSSVRELIKGNRLSPSDAIAHGQQTLEWLQDHWFSSPNYVQFKGKPLFLVWGGNGGYFQGAQWNEIFAPLKIPPAYFSELGRNPPAIGGFGWPVPDGGTQASFEALDRFYNWYPQTQNFIAVAYPRFHDIYAEAGVHKSWGSIDDQNGKTYEETLTRALQSQSPIVQIATWNDWGEGTQIEPSVQFGYRDLETTQKLRRKYIDPAFPYTAQDLRLPVRLYELRKAHKSYPAAQARLDQIASLLFHGNTRRARAELTAFKSGGSRH